MANHKYDYLFKLLIIGESGVGKTCLLLRFTDDSFTANHLTTIGIDFKIKIINLENKLIKLQIWDTAGQERFRTITKTYYKGAHGIILTYDVTDANSFKNIRNWIKQIEANAQTNVCKVLVGNKCDKPDRTVTEEEGKKLAEDFGMILFETSAKTNKNVSEVFNYLTTEILKSNAGKTTSDNKKLSSEVNNKSGKKGCCK
jgi:Ras-related protein Rab-8A